MRKVQLSLSGDGLRTVGAKPSWRRGPTRWIKAVLVLLLPTVSLGFPYSVAAEEECRPLVVMYAGLYSKTSKRGMWPFCKSYTPPNAAEKKCTTHDDYDSDDIVEHVDGNESTRPVVLIGHSYGGDTAYVVAKELPGSYELTLITLDPVARKGVSNKLSKGSVSRWVNLYRSAKESRADNAIAWIGISWRKQMSADRNLVFEGNHNSVGQMMQRVRSEVTRGTICSGEKESE